MRIFGLEITRTKAAGLSPVDGGRGWRSWIRDPYAGAWQNGDSISVDTQLAYYAVYACVSRISGDGGKLRPRLVEKDDNGIWSETTSPAFSPVLRKPNRFQNHIQFKESWFISKLTHGNTYALKQRDARLVVTGLYILDPCRVTPLVAPDGSVFYKLSADNLSGLQDDVTVPASEIIHDRMNTLFHPLVGVSPLYACGLAAAQGLAIQTQSKSFFGNGARPSGVLTAPGAIQQETADRLKAHWDQNYSGANAGRVAVLGDGLTYAPMMMSATDAQLIEQLKITAEMVCTAFSMPSFKVGVGSNPTFQNGDILNQIYYTDCLQSHIEQFELCMDEGLGIGEGVTTQNREIGVDLDLDGLFRMDQASQAKMVSEAIGGGFMSPNEGRAKFDLPPVKGGESPLAQQQNYSLAALAKRDAKEDPFATAKPDAPAPTTPPAANDDAEKFAAALQIKFLEATVNG